jgi:hypothetical protein
MCDTIASLQTKAHQSSKLSMCNFTKTTTTTTTTTWIPCDRTLGLCRTLGDLAQGLHCLRNPYLGPNQSSYETKRKRIRLRLSGVAARQDRCEWSSN